jgi:hypothetical protein
MRALSALCLVLLSGPAHAATEACLTSIDGVKIPLSYERKDAALKANRSARERLFGGYGEITCPSFVTLRQMTPGLTDDQRQSFCLLFDEDRDTYRGFMVGARDAWLGCRSPAAGFCRHVNATRDTALAVTGALAQAVTAPAPDDTAGSSVLDAASGALIASGAGSYITSTLGAAASSALATLTAPATLTAAAVTVGAVGGAVYVCN